MSPFVCLLYNIFYLRYSIHIAHFGMTVKLYTLLWPGIHTSGAEITDFLDSYYRADGQLTVKTINGSDTFQLHKSTFFQILCQLRYLFRCKENLHRNGICEVRNIHHNNGLLISDISGLQCTDTSTDDHFSHFPFNGTDLDSLFVNISSVDHIRIIRTFQPTAVISATFSGKTSPAK